MATKAQLEEQVRQLEKNQRGESIVTLDSIKPSGVEQLHSGKEPNRNLSGKPVIVKPKPKRRRPAKPKAASVAQRLADIEARVDELEAYEATDEYGQKIYPPDADSAWADSRRLFEKARQAWADRNGKELRRCQVAQGQPPR
jgi:hypothetical protein